VGPGGRPLDTESVAPIRRVSLAPSARGSALVPVSCTPMDPRLPHRKVWIYPLLLSEHAFDKLRLIDCTFGEFERALAGALVIEEHALSSAQLKVRVLTVEWVRPLHVIVVVDAHRHEERIVTVYEPDPRRWSQDYRRRR